MAKEYYKNKHGMVYWNESVALPRCRAAFVFLKKPKDPPKQQEGENKKPGEPRFEYIHLLPKDGKHTQSVIKELIPIKNKLLKVFNEDKSAKISIDDIFIDGDSPKFDKEKYPFYKGMWLIPCRTPVYYPPNVISGHPEVQDEEAIDKITGGVEVKALVKPYVTSHGLAYRIDVVQFVKDDGTRFGNAGQTTDEYKEKLNSKYEDAENAANSYEDDEVEIDEDDEDTSYEDSDYDDEVEEDEVEEDEVEEEPVKKVVKKVIKKPEATPSSPMRKVFSKNK